MGRRHRFVHPTCQIHQWTNVSLYARETVTFTYYALKGTCPYECPSKGEPKPPCDTSIFVYVHFKRAHFVDARNQNATNITLLLRKLHT